SDRRRLALFELLQAVSQPCLILADLQPLDRGEARIRDLGSSLDRHVDTGGGLRPQAVDRAVARDRHQPSDGARNALIKARRLAPYRQINVLQHVRSLASVA